MAATHHGTITTTNPGSVTQVGAGVTHSVVKTMTHEQARAAGTHQAMQVNVTVQGHVLSLIDYVITYEPGDLASVVYNYGQAVAVANPEVVPINGNLAYPGRLPAAVTEFYELDISLEVVSILRHERYDALTTADRQILAMMIQAGPLDGEGNARRDSLSASSLAQECANKIEAGQVSVLKPKHVWRYRKLNTNWVIPSSIGKISQPYGPAPDIDGNWLFTGVTGNGWEGGALELTATWESSPDGDTWDTDLYAP